MHECEVLIFGDYFCDTIITGLPELPRLGADIYGDGLEIAPGGAYILTTALHRLGVRVRWHTRLGNDLFSRFTYEQARREGLETSLFEVFDHPLRSLSVSFSFVHDRGFISHVDHFPEFQPEAIISAQKPRWVVNAPFDGTNRSRQIIELVHEHGGQVYTDCQYTTSTLNDDGSTDTLCMIDIFAPNQSEAAQLTGESDPEKAEARLAEFCPLVIVKCGAQGAYARAGKKTWHSPAIQVRVIDTTGAGDAFNAGFLAAHLNGESIETCLRYGNICGGLSTTQCGGPNATPTLSELKQYL